MIYTNIGNWYKWEVAKDLEGGNPGLFEDTISTGANEKHVGSL